MIVIFVVIKRLEADAATMNGMNAIDRIYSTEQQKTKSIWSIQWKNLQGTYTL